MNAGTGDARPGRVLDAAPGGDADARAFAHWIEPHWLVLHRVAVRLCGSVDGEDVLQEALSAAWRKRGQFDPARGPARAWLLAITADQARKHWHRIGGRHRRRDVIANDAQPDRTADHAVAVDLSRAISRLSDRQRLAVSLFYYADLSVAEVAQAMGCSGGTVKSTLSDARRRLQGLLGGGY